MNDILFMLEKIYFLIINNNQIIFFIKNDKENYK